MATYQPARRIDLRSHDRFNEEWLQKAIEDDPSLLGLGDVRLRDVQRKQGRGRLDLLLQDDDANRRYTVELQLGPTDASHIIRCLEYWDIERKRYPQYDHCAVIVAEDITARFLNVISLFNGSVPIIAIQAGAYQIGDAATLIFTKVLDENVRGPVDEDEPVSVRADRAYWEAKPQGKQFLEIADAVMGLANRVRAGIGTNYTKNYISPTFDGVVSNRFILVQRKVGAAMYIYMERSDLIDEQLANSTLEYEPYNQRRGLYLVRIRFEEAKTKQADIGSLLVRVLEAGPAEA